jgi:DNA-binding CsgD family transcriptional regulator
MTGDSDPIDALALRFYDAAADPALFAGLMADICEYLRFSGGTFMVWDHASNRFLLNGTFGADESYARLYEDHYGAIDPRQALVMTKPVGLIVRCHEYFDDAFVSGNEVYNDCMIPMGARYIAATRLTPDAEVSAFLNFGRTTRMGPVDDATAQAIARLLPHATRAAKLSQRFFQLQQAADRIEAALDRVDWGVLITDATGRVMTANWAAEECLRGGDGLSTVQGRLTAAVSRDQARLGVLIQGAANASDTFGGALAIERPSRRRPLNLLVAPLPLQWGALRHTRLGSVMITIADPETAAAPSASVLASLYGLSARESVVAMALADGLSIEQIAESQHRSRETIRGQVKSALSKTGASRQAELVRLVLTLPRTLGRETCS